MKLTDEQERAIEQRGRVIVSASAGSGKTFVMIRRLVDAVVGGVDLDDVLAVTFTKKAAAQMKEKLRAEIIARLEKAEGEQKTRLKTQLAKIPSANISTIHAFCGKLLRTYFYELGIDSSFDVISSDDAAARDLKARAMDSLFERLYEEDGEDFRLLLSCFMRKRNDGALRKLVSEAYNAVRSTAHYDGLLKDAAKPYTEEGFQRVCEELKEIRKNSFNRLICAVECFESEFPTVSQREVYDKIFNEIKVSLAECRELHVCAPKPKLSVTQQPDLSEDEEYAKEIYKKFRDRLSRRYKALNEFADEQTERERYFKSGKAAVAFSKLLLAFDEEYYAVKTEENKLDFNDLEHLTLRLLENESVREEIKSGFKYVFVDEYQDVNPVQEEIVGALAEESFFVGDVKQAIYGFRGSKSRFFTEKFQSYENGAGNALLLSSNFRSSDGVLDFVNDLFSDVMRPETCGIDYSRAPMRKGGLYPAGYGGAEIKIFGKDEEEERGEPCVYSVKGDARSSKHTREGLAVLETVKRELSSKWYDIKSKEKDEEKKYRDVQAGDICILTRKNKGESAGGIVRALTDAGYTVAGAQEDNICDTAEVKQMLDILSLIDDGEQDIPLITALLSPLGGFTEDELAQIRIASGNTRTADGDYKTFRQCCKDYQKLPGIISQKLSIFGGQLQKLRSLAEVVSTGELIDELLETYGLEYAYGADGERKVKNVLRLAEEGAALPLCAFLQKIKAGEFKISAPEPAPSDSIKIQTMHASKGLEYPVVILADICRTFKGRDYSEAPFDGEWGFAPKCFDGEKMLAYPTVLRRLVKMRSDLEELKNEINLFYVACTRAMCRLYVFAKEAEPFDEIAELSAKSYSRLFDISKFARSQAEPEEFEPKAASVAHVGKPDGELVERIESKFGAPYKYASSVDLPVKSSASAILRAIYEQPHYAEHSLFAGEGETSTDKGTAYHRFLELCDFSMKGAEEIRGELDGFVRAGKITEEQLALLNAEELSQILAMPAFADLRGAELYREQEFLCRLPANELYDTDAEDGVLIQGAIDLLARRKGEVKIIDYKYSHKSDEELIRDYCRQLELYEKAVTLITGEKNIKKIIVNIRLKRQIDL